MCLFYLLWVKIRWLHIHIFFSVFHIRWQNPVAEIIGHFIWHLQPVTNFLWSPKYLLFVSCVNLTYSEQIMEGGLIY